MKKIITNLYDKTAHLLSESIIDDVAKLLGSSSEDVEKAVKALDFANYLELGNAVNLEDKGLVQEILGMAPPVDEYSAFDADDEDEDDEDTGINFVDQISDDGDSDDIEDDDLYIDDDAWLEEADNAYGGGGDNSFSKPSTHSAQQTDDEEEEGDEDEASVFTATNVENPGELRAAATKNAAQKTPRTSVQLSPNDKATALKRISSLKKGEKVFVRGMDGRPVEVTYQGADKSRLGFMAAVRSSKDGNRVRTFGYDDIVSANELDSAGQVEESRWPKPKDPWMPDTPIPKKFFRNGKLVKDQAFKSWLEQQKKQLGETMEYEGASAESVASAIWQRIRVRHLDLLDKYGIDALNSAVGEISEFHAGAEELGSSDVSIMVNQVQDQLARENPRAGCVACEGGGLDEWGDICVTCGDYDTLDMDEDRMRKLAGLAPISESASYGVYRTSKGHTPEKGGHTGAASAEVKRGGKHLTFKTEAEAKAWVTDNAKGEELFVRKASKKVNPVKETASGGATGAGAVAVGAVAVGGMQKRNPSIYATAKKPEPKPKPSKKGKKDDGVGRNKKT